MEAYYYSQMNKAQQNAYHDMKTGLLALAPSFPVTRLEGRELSDVYFKLRLDCPEIFYTSGFRYRFYPDGSSVEVVPEYLFEKSKIRDHQRAMKSRVEKLARPAVQLGEWEKERYIHDFICQNVRYDKLKKAYSHEIIGPLGQGVGVCEGIAKAVKILCDALGIWCVIAVSEANPEKKIKYRHAWNVVRVGGTCCHLDATFDNTLGQGGTIRYDYFNLDDKRLFRDHEPVIWRIPACSDGTHSYYREKKLSFTRMEEVEKRAKQAAKKGRVLVFHWRGGCLTRDVLRDILGILGAAGREKNKYARIGVNWPQAVIQVSFDDEMPEQEVVIEEANEGEKS